MGNLIPLKIAAIEAALDRAASRWELHVNCQHLQLLIDDELCCFEAIHQCDCVTDGQI